MIASNNFRSLCNIELIGIRLSKVEVDYNTKTKYKFIENKEISEILGVFYR